jgi:hypothetical protein
VNKSLHVCLFGKKENSLCCLNDIQRTEEKKK